MNEVDLRLMRAAVAVAEELSFSRASARLHISQPALTKQIQDLEGLLQTKLFARSHQKVTVTDAGHAFIAEAQLALVHQQRAVQAARSAVNGAEALLNVGQSPSVDPLLTSIVSSIHLPLFPNLRLHILSDYSPELVRRIIVGEIDLAIVEAGVESRQLSSIELARSPFYILLNQSTQLADSKELTLADLRDMPWILFAHHVHPMLYDAIIDRAANAGMEPLERHHVTTAEQAAQLVQSTGGVAFLTKRGAWKMAIDGLTMRPLKESTLEIRTVLTARNDAGRLVSEFVRAVVRKTQKISAPYQQDLPLAI